MSQRARFLIGALIIAIVAVGLCEFAKAHEWSRAELYVAAAGLGVLVSLAANVWIEFAPGGAFRPHEPSG
jgi:fucose permease